MNIKEFIENLNKSPLVKRGILPPITSTLLRELNLIQKDYDPNRDILELRKRIFFVQPQIIFNKTDEQAKKRE